MAENTKNSLPQKLIILAIAFTAVAVFLRLAVNHLSFHHQIAIGWGLFILLMVLKKFESFKKAPWRIIFIVIATFISLRYWLWRTSDTLLFTGPLDFIAMMLLYLAETYAILIHIVGLFVNIWPLQRKYVPMLDYSSPLPTVDVFIATYTEPEEIVRITATAATQIDYPADKLRVHILDDGSTTARRNNPGTAAGALERYETLKLMAEELGANYIPRKKNEGAKAGNINYAMNHTDGDLILVLDCDHVPTRDILKNTVGYFSRDEKLFLVQTPHFLINPDPVEKKLELHKLHYYPRDEKFHVR